MRNAKKTSQSYVISKLPPILFRNRFYSETQLIAEWILLLYLFSPMLIYVAVAPKESTVGNGLFWFNVVTSLLWLGVLWSINIRPLFKYAFLAPFFITVSIDIFLLFQFKARLSSGYIIIGMTNLGELSDFLTSYSRPILLTVSVLIILFGMGLYSVRNMQRKRDNRYLAAYLICLSVVYLAVFIRGIRTDDLKSVVLDIVGKEMSSPAGIIFQSALVWELNSLNEEYRQQRDKHHPNSRQTVAIPSEIYVFVIGESSRPQNWSLFGYQRQTTPNLSQLTNLIPLPKIITTAPLTSIAVPSMLSLNSIRDWASIVSTKSIITSFRDVGFKTYWFSIQEADSWGGMTPLITREAETVRYFDRSHDIALIKPFMEAITDHPSDRLFFVLHTKGSHFGYSRRYPDTFNIFSGSNLSWKENMINSYDNSIYYTDYILSNLIKILNESNRSAVMIYASDHGENLMDDEQELFGHSMGTKYDLASAAFIWYSEEFMTAKPDKIMNAQKNSRNFLSLSNISHSLLSIADISTDGLHLDQSIFDDAFFPGEIWYKVRDSVFRYSPAKVDKGK